MNRKLIALLSACILLTGCGGHSVPTVQTAPPATETTVIEPDESLPFGTPLLEQGIPVEESENLLRIPVDHFEQMEWPEMQLLGNGLLLSGHAGKELVLHHIRLEDGMLLRSASIPAGADTKVVIGDGEIGLCDRESGLVTILDESFRILRTYPVTAGGDDWFLNSELDTLYIVYSDRGLVAKELESGAEFCLMDNAYGMTCQNSSCSYVIVEYTDRADQKTYIRCLDLSTATLETLPAGGNVSTWSRQGETWLIPDRDRQYRYYLVRGEELLTFMGDDTPVYLLSPRLQFLAMDPSQRNLTLYDADGSFLSRCSLPQNSNAMVSTNFIWSSYWDGYFFLDFIGSSCQLMFWDVNADTTGEDLPISPAGTAEKPEPLLAPALYERAEELSRRFGMDIRIGEQCSLDYESYDSYVLTDTTSIRYALDVLEDAFSQYPEGFFRQLTYGSQESIRIELVADLKVKETAAVRSGSTGGFAQEYACYYLIVLNVSQFGESTVFHEISHVIDRRLGWDAKIRPEALYSEDVWLALQPEGFYYADSYLEMPEELLAYVDAGHFIMDYSMTFPTEDRAVLMAAAMQLKDWYFEDGSCNREKMRFYAECIRDCFDTDGWPEVTLWEQILK